jgi:hypothetical protein
MDAIQAVQKLVADYLLLKESNQKLTEEIETMKLMLSPPAIPPVAEVPVRILSLNIDEERE